MNFCNCFLFQTVGIRPHLGFFQGCHIYVLIISQNLKYFHCKLVYSEFGFISTSSSDYPCHCIVCDKEIGLYQCFSNWVLWNSRILQRGVRGSERRNLAMAVVHLYVRIKIHLATFDSDHFVTDSMQSILQSRSFLIL